MCQTPRMRGVSYLQHHMELGVLCDLITIVVTHFGSLSSWEGLGCDPD